MAFWKRRAQQSAVAAFQEEDHLRGTDREAKDYMAAASKEITPRHIVLGDTYLVVLFIANYPPFLDDEWLFKLYEYRDSLDISIMLEPMDTGKAIQSLQRRMEQTWSTYAMKQQRGQVDIRSEIKLQDAAEQQALLQSSAAKMVLVSMYIGIYGDSEEDVEDKRRQVENLLGELNIQSKPAYLRMNSGFQTISPLAKNALGEKRSMNSLAAATFFPLLYAGERAAGLYLGNHLYTGNPYFFDPLARVPIILNSFTVGQTGAGKSMAKKHEIAQYRSLYDAKVVVIDPNGEYVLGCEAFGGEHMELSLDSGLILNPFDLRYSGVTVGEEFAQSSFRNKLDFLQGFFVAMLHGEVDGVKKAILDRLFRFTYQAKGITTDPSTHDRTAPTISDFAEVLSQVKQKNPEHQRELEEIALGIETYTQGAESGLFDGQTNVDFGKDYVVIDTRMLSDNIRPQAFSLITELCWREVLTTNPDRIKLLVVDEGWWMMQYPDTARFLAFVVRQARKFAAGLHIMTQNLEDFIGTAEGRAIVENCPMKWIMKHSSELRNDILEAFPLSENEQAVTANLTTGEALFLCNEERVPLQVEIFDFEMDLFTTDPVALREKYSFG